MPHGIIIKVLRYIIFFIRLIHIDYTLLVKVGKTGKAVGIEHIEQLVKKSIEDVNKWNPSLYASGNIKLISKMPCENYVKM